VYYKSKKWDDAYEDLSRSIELNPLRSGKTINNRGLVLIKLNHEIEACEDFEEAMKLKYLDGKLNYEKYCK
jgi:regulator of sirC expression with transglutaminase-like and TPR domain